MREVAKLGVVVPVPDGALQGEIDLEAWATAWARMTPAERADAEATARANRQAVRDRAEHAELTLEVLADKLGWTVEYALHFIQPYCTCGDTWDGWHFCQHAIDLGLNQR